MTQSDTMTRNHWVAPRSGGQLGLLCNPSKGYQREHAKPVAIGQETGNILHLGLGDTRDGPGCHMLEEVQGLWLQRQLFGKKLPPTHPHVVERTADKDHTVSSFP